MTGRSSKLKFVHIANDRKRRIFNGQPTDPRRLAKSKDLINANLIDWDDLKYDPICTLITDLVNSLKDKCPMSRKGLCTGFLDAEFKIIVDWRTDIIGWEAAIDATTYPCKVLLKTTPKSSKHTFEISRGVKLEENTIKNKHTFYRR